MEIRAITGLRNKNPHYRDYQVVFTSAGTQEVLIKPGSIGDSILPQYAMIDATNMSAPVIMKAGDVHYTIAAGSTVGFPVIMGSSENLFFTSIGTGALNLILSDTNIPPFSASLLAAVSLASALPEGSNLIGAVSISPASSELVDASGTIATASASQAVYTANAATLYMQLQNISAGQMFYNFDADASDGAGSYSLAPGASISFQDTFIPSGALNIWCASAGAAFTCKYA